MAGNLATPIAIAPIDTVRVAKILTDDEDGKVTTALVQMKSGDVVVGEIPLTVSQDARQSVLPAANPVAGKVMGAAMILTDVPMPGAWDTLKSYYGQNLAANGGSSVATFQAWLVSVGSLPAVQ